MTNSKGGFKAGTKKAKLAGQRSARSRAYNKLQLEYNNTTSVGIRSALRKKMNALPTL